MPSPDRSAARVELDPWTPDGGAPVSDTVGLYGGVFFIFAPVMTLFVSDLAPDRAWSRLAIWFVISGVIGVLFAAAGTWRRWLMWPGIALNAAGIFSMIARWPPALFLENKGLRLEGIAVVACIGIGYFLFVRFIRSETARSERLRAELALAAQIHRTLVPPLDLRAPGAEVFGRSEPSTEMGGDLIDAVEHAGATDLYLADVAGHGVKAGVLMGMVKSAVRMRMIGDGPGPPLEHVVSDLNRAVCQVSTPEMFVTFAALRLPRGGSGPSQSIELVLAGHLPALVVRAGASRCEQVGNDSLPLGVTDTEEFRATRLDLGPGDLVVLYTDGLTEAMSPAQQLFGLARLEACIAGAAGRPLEEIHRAVTDAVRAHTGSDARADDQTLLLVRLCER